MIKSEQEYKRSVERVEEEKRRLALTKEQLKQQGLDDESALTMCLIY